MRGHKNIKGSDRSEISVQYLLCGKGKKKLRARANLKVKKLKNLYSLFVKILGFLAQILSYTC